jgi:hypothetical protein
MMTRKKPTHDPISLATAWAWQAMDIASRRGVDEATKYEEWQRARRLWAMVDRMRGVE